MADLEGLTIQQLRPDIKEQVEERIGESGFFGDLAVMPDSQRVIKKLTDKYEISITTAAMEFPLSFDAKFHWLESHFPYINPMNIVFAAAKASSMRIILSMITPVISSILVARKFYFLLNIINVYSVTVDKKLAGD